MCTMPWAQQPSDVSSSCAMVCAFSQSPDCRCLTASERGCFAENLRFVTAYPGWRKQYSMRLTHALDGAVLLQRRWLALPIGLLLAAGACTAESADPGGGGGGAGPGAGSTGVIPGAGTGGGNTMPGGGSTGVGTSGQGQGGAAPVAGSTGASGSAGAPGGGSGGGNSTDG